MRDKIRVVEEDFCSKYFGDDMYEYMLDHLTVIEDGQPTWEKGKVYQIDDEVVREQCIWKNTVDCNGADPLLDNSGWEAIKKFDTDCLNDMYCGYLRSLLAYMIYMRSVGYTTLVSTAGGLVVRGEDARNGSSGTRSANKGEMAANNSNLEYDVNLFEQAMTRWLKKNRKTCDFPSIAALDCGTSALTTNTPHTRKWMLNTRRR